MSRYRVLVSFDAERQVYVARAPELEHCSAEGATRAEAVAKVEEEIAAQLDLIRDQGGQPPRAVDDGDGPATGELAVKLSKGLHRELLWQARVEGIELAQLVGELCAAGLEARKGRPRRAPDANERPPHAGRPPRDDRPRDGRYQAIMEDKATFLEYVRNLEQGGGRPPRRGGGRRGGGEG